MAGKKYWLWPHLKTGNKKLEDGAKNNLILITCSDLSITGQMVVHGAEESLEKVKWQNGGTRARYRYVNIA